MISLYYNLGFGSISFACVLDGRLLIQWVAVGATLLFACVFGPAFSDRGSRAYEDCLLPNAVTTFMRYTFYLSRGGSCGLRRLSFR